MIDWAEVNRNYYERLVWQDTWWGSRRIVKYPTDLWVYQEVIERAKPEVIIETGSWDGGSASWFSQYAEVISIDLHSPPSVPGVIFVQGSSLDVLEQVTELLDGRTCMVSLDSNHNCDHVLAEMWAYAPLATQYMIVEDTAVDAYGLDAEMYPNGGPGRAVERFLQSNPEWEPDLVCDRFMLGMNPGGWLRRKKA